jgi:parallel beta-helix repeat protein
MVGEPAAFMSYVRFNDQHDDGQLTQFRERLSGEVRAQTGKKFVIFQDRNDIAWGQNWQQRIDEALDAVTLLLVIITPNLFQSPKCRAEFAKFRERERALDREDLILPVYYIGAQEMDDPGLQEGDEMAHVLATRQYADWRHLRFEPFTSPQVLRAIAQLASRIRDIFRQPLATPVGPTGRSQVTRSSTASAEPVGNRGRVTAKAEPPTHVVDAFLRGDFATVSRAIEAAKPGDRILVRPGLYEEGLVMDKPLEILGDGPAEDIVIRARGTEALLFKASMGRVANLTLHQAGGEGGWFGVDITQGRLDLEGCDISSQSLSGVAIRDGADPRLRRNRLHGSEQAGVLVLNGGLGTLEDNDITGNRYAGVQIQTDANPTLRRNRIHDNIGTGVFVQNDGSGTLEDNDITGNGEPGVQIQTGGDPILRHNQIRDNRDDGVFVTSDGLGLLEDNDITGNTISGVETGSGGNPVVRGNRINRNGTQAVAIWSDGCGVIEDNDLTDNPDSAWFIEVDAGHVDRARNKE